MYYLNYLYLNNLMYSETTVKKNNDTASTSAYSMLGILIVSVAASIIMANYATKSIADPLFELGAAADRAAKGKKPIADHKYLAFNDEISFLSQKLNEMYEQLSNVQELKLESLKARHEKERAETTSRTKSDFLTKISHEIQAPMDILASTTELALKENLPSDVSLHIQTIKQAGTDILSIFNDILDFS
jgi:signal transduction histidine kinase